MLYGGNASIFGPRVRGRGLSTPASGDVLQERSLDGYPEAVHRVFGCRLACRGLGGFSLRVTYHHNYFDGTKTRHPRVRFAEGVHVFNNLYRDCEYGVAAVMDAAVLVEGNVFDKVSKPTLTGYGDSPDPGRLVESGNLFTRSGPPQVRGDVPKSLIPYHYQLDPVSSIQESVARQAGPKER